MMIRITFTAQESHFEDDLLLMRYPSNGLLPAIKVSWFRF